MFPPVTAFQKSNTLFLIVYFIKYFRPAYAGFDDSGRPVPYPIISLFRFVASLPL